jgi:adenine/guanine phosphoribosyltransferase-like PRPP-binding protein
MTEEGPASLDQRLRRLVRDVPDYPRAGIMFKDITPLLGDPESFRLACEAMAATFRHERVTHVAAVESRGFLFGSPIAMKLKAGVVPIRKRGKLPYDSEFEEYELNTAPTPSDMLMRCRPARVCWLSMTCSRREERLRQRAAWWRSCREP